MVLGFAEPERSLQQLASAYAGSGFAWLEPTKRRRYRDVDERAHVIRGAGDHIQDARRQSRFHPQLGEAQGRLRRGTGGLDASTKVFPAARHRIIRREESWPENSTVQAQRHPPNKYWTVSYWEDTFISDSPLIEAYRKQTLTTSCAFKTSPRDSFHVFPCSVHSNRTKTRRGVLPPTPSSEEVQHPFVHGVSAMSEKPLGRQRRRN